jgi:RNA-directed DNA polymerase
MRGKDIGWQPHTVHGANKAEDSSGEYVQELASDVKRLRARIAEAPQERRWGKVNALQRLRTRSRSCRMLTVKRVTGNRGKSTPRVDGKMCSSKTAGWNGITSLHHRGRRAISLRRVYFPSNGEQLPPGIPCMRYRTMQGIWKLTLERMVAAQTEPNFHRSRLGPSTGDAIEHRFITLAIHAARDDRFIPSLTRLLEERHDSRHP